MSKRKNMSQPHRVVMIPAHTRADGSTVRGHSRRIPLPDVGGAFASATSRQAIGKQNRNPPRVSPPTGGTGGYTSVTDAGGQSAVSW